MVQKKQPPHASKEAPAEPKRRGRPRAYQPDVALGKALDLFRKGGFAATSLDDLSSATGMNRPSLYAAFGDKEALYLKLLSGYARGGERAMQAALAPDKPLRDGLMAVYDAALAMYFPAGATATGCFLVGTAVTASRRSSSARTSRRPGATFSA